jgi:hypothetical protein
MHTMDNPNIQALADLLQTPLTRSRIVYELIRLDDEADTSVAPWPVAYAKDLLAKYG